MITDRREERRVNHKLKRIKTGITLFSFLLMTPLMLAATTDVLESTRRTIMVILGFSFIIFIHELGHFIVARFFGVVCPVFSIGMGPRMLGWRKGAGLTFGEEKEETLSKADEAMKEAIQGDLETTAPDGVKETTRKAIGETDYRISWLPLGGYVRMLGQDDMDPTSVSQHPRAYNNKPIWQRMCIVSAGVVMNVILAAVIFAIVFSPEVGVPFPPAIIGAVQYNSPADKAGLQPGDEIVAINGQGAWPKGAQMEFTDLVIASALSTGQTDINLEYRRNGEEKTRTTTLRPVKDENLGMLAIGVAPSPSLVIAGLDQTRLPEEMKDVKPGDRITAINGKPLKSYAELYQAIQENGAKPMTLTLLPAPAKKDSAPSQSATKSLTVQPRLDPRDPSAAWSLLGIYPRVKIALNPEAGTPAAKAGLKEGDVVTRIGVINDPTGDEFMKTIQNSGGSPVDLDILRAGKTETFKITPAKIQGAYRIGVNPTIDLESTAIAAAEMGEAGFSDGVMRGSEMKSVNGKPIASLHEFIAAARDMKPGQNAEITFRNPDGSEQKVTWTLSASQAKVLGGYHYVLGIPLETLYSIQKADSISNGVAMGIDHTRKFILQTYMTLRGLFLRTVSPNQLHGPLGIAKLGHDVQDRGQAYLWYVLGMVSVNLAVANFLPLPIVDGGLFLLLLIEKLRGKPLPMKVLSAINVAGLCLLVSLFLFVTIFNDLPMFSR